MKTQIHALTALAAHLEIVSKNVRTHGSGGWTYDEEVVMLKAAAEEIRQLRADKRDMLREINRLSGELNGANNAVEVAASLLSPNTKISNSGA